MGNYNNFYINIDREPQSIYSFIHIAYVSTEKQAVLYLPFGQKQ